jgi:hypothetical protein
MELTDWIAELRAAGVARVTLALATASPDARGHLPLDTPRDSFPADQAPRDPVAHAQAESTNAHSTEPDDGDEDQQARDLELAHTE